ncbi:hypothetical protein QBC39DRAFT_126777 [Podospora conica]|nr:hypothetical protein QBC39DRAFT_126777 [Schizothecium conicum]
MLDSSWVIACTAANARLHRLGVSPILCTGWKPQKTGQQVWPSLIGGRRPGVRILSGHLCPVRPVRLVGRGLWPSAPATIKFGTLSWCCAWNFSSSHRQNSNPARLGSTDLCRVGVELGQLFSPNIEDSRGGTTESGCRPDSALDETINPQDTLSRGAESYNKGLAAALDNTINPQDTQALTGHGTESYDVDWSAAPVYPILNSIANNHVPRPQTPPAPISTPSSLGPALAAAAAAAALDQNGSSASSSSLGQNTGNMELVRVEGRYRCLYNGCERASRWAGDIRKHIEAVHLQSRRTCPKCFKSLGSRQDNLKRHIMRCKGKAAGSSTE